MAIFGLDSTSATASLAGRRGQHLHAAPFQHAGQREDVAGVVVDQQRGLADQILIGTVELLQHPLLFDRQFRDHTVQKQRRFVEQAFRQLHALHHDAARHGVEFRVFLGRKFPPGEHDHRNIRQRVVVADPVEHLEAAHVGQPQIEHDAIAGAVAQRRERAGAGIGGHDLDIVVIEQFRDAHLLGGIVLDDQQALAARFGVFLDLRQRRADAFGRRRLVDEGERAARQRVLAVFVERDDLDRNVPRQRIVLELAQHGPAQHVRQEHVERNRRRLELLGEFERLGAAAATSTLKPLSRARSISTRA